jgi:mycoredoxin
MTQIKVYGSQWCGDTLRALRILDKRNIAYEWIDIDRDKSGEKIVKNLNNGYRSVPTIVFPDESILVEPSNQQLNEKLDQL